MFIVELVILNDWCVLNVLYMWENVLYILFFYVFFFIFCKEFFKNEIVICLCMGYINENILKVLFFFYYF